MEHKQDIKVTVLPVGPLECNCIIVTHVSAKESLIIDPGGNAEAILAECKETTVRYILITHCHFDHILALSHLYHLLSSSPPQIASHSSDSFLLDHFDIQCASFGISIPTDSKSQPYPMPSPSLDLRTLPTFELPAPDKSKPTPNTNTTCTVTTLFTPGHTPGSCCFVVEKVEQGEEKEKRKKKTLFVATGDTLFCGSIGRTDFPGGDFAQIVKSIQTQLYQRTGDSVRVIPGHGPETTIGREKKSNMFVRAEKSAKM